MSREHFLPEAFREGWLVFESPEEKRRLAPVPSDWETMPIDALAALCGKASPQPARTRSAPDAKSAADVKNAPDARSAAPPEPLRPQLSKAEQQLDKTLAEVCETPTASRLDTGQLIRVEESLALATEAAKEAVSLRRKMSADRERAGRAAGTEQAAPPTPKEAEDRSTR